MALDGAFLHEIAHELSAVLLDSRVDKVFQPSREEIILLMRWRGGSARLLLSAGADSPRIHFTRTAPENPKTPPMFCMLLRKHLGSGRLVEIRQLGMDRILHLIFESVNEMGDLVRLTLAVEIMGRHSNIILVGPDGKIIDSVKRIDMEMSSVRQILPGMGYVLPPPQTGKLSLLENTGEEIAARVENLENTDLAKALMKVIQGVSPVLCREAASYAVRGLDVCSREMDPEQRRRLAEYLDYLSAVLKDHTGSPVLLSEPDGRPREFSFVPINQYRGALVSKEYPSYSELLDSFYGDRDLMERMKQRSHDLLRLLANASDRVSRKIEAQREQLADCAHRDTLRQYGDLINAGLYSMEKGMTELETQNFYDEALPAVTIPLDPRLTPSQNAQKYYAEYRKADTAERMLTGLIVQGEEELAYLDTVFDSLVRATREAELSALRDELTAAGYLKNRGPRNKRPEKLEPLRYRSADGFTILVGRNNVQNDKLTLKDAHNYDIWFHTQKIPGSHTIVVSGGKPVPNSTLEQAAIIAAYNSRARDSALVPVDYTVVKNVKKPQGARPGRVIYSDFETAVVTPDRQLVESLRVE
ncbi:MAG: NFACT RNA binding domain-containing protein [Oscillospiraceae bacterium]|nr:NFACT RNA binding domain-containing protein [Oscillospiraceae bacterium]